jgi:hypothetical protein
LVIAGRDDEKPVWNASQQLAVAEVAILGDDHAILAVG